MKQVRVWTEQMQLWGWIEASRSQKEPCTCPESSPGYGRRLLPPREGQALEIYLKGGRVTLGGGGGGDGEQFLVHFVVWQDRVFAKSTGSQPGSGLLSRGHLATFRNIFGCHSWWAGATSLSWVEDRAAAKHLQCSPHNRVIWPKCQ